MNFRTWYLSLLRAGAGGLISPLPYNYHAARRWFRLNAEIREHLNAWPINP